MIRGLIPVAIVVAIGLAVTAAAFLSANRAEERRVVRGLEFRGTGAAATPHMDVGER